MLAASGDDGRRRRGRRGRRCRCGEALASGEVQATSTRNPKTPTRHL